MTTTGFASADFNEWTVADRARALRRRAAGGVGRLDQRLDQARPPRRDRQDAAARDRPDRAPAASSRRCASTAAWSTSARCARSSSSSSSTSACCAAGARRDPGRLVAARRRPDGVPVAGRVGHDAGRRRPGARLRRPDGLVRAVQRPLHARPDGARCTSAGWRSSPCSCSSPPATGGRREPPACVTGELRYGVTHELHDQHPPIVPASEWETARRAAAGQGEGADARPRRARRPAPPDAPDGGGEGVRLRGPGRARRACSTCSRGAAS